MERGLIPPEEFITIETGQQQIVTRHFRNKANVRSFYEGKTQYKVKRASLFAVQQAVSKSLETRTCWGFDKLTRSACGYGFSCSLHVTATGLPFNKFPGTIFLRSPRNENVPRVFIPKNLPAGYCGEPSGRPDIDRGNAESPAPDLDIFF